MVDGRHAVGEKADVSNCRFLVLLGRVSVLDEKIAPNILIASLYPHSNFLELVSFNWPASRQAKRCFNVCRESSPSFLELRWRSRFSRLSCPGECLIAEK